MRNAFLSSCTVLIAACSSTNSALNQPTPDAAKAGGVAVAPLAYDSSVSADQRALVEEDLNRLDKLSFAASAERANVEKMLGLSNLTGHALNIWFHQRIKYIVGDSFNTDANVKVLSNTAYADLRIGEFSDFGGFITAALNLTPGIYSYGKNQNELMSIEINGSPIALKSPRTGVLQISSGLLTDHYLANPSQADAISNTFSRLPVLFHEARHSDGNGDHVGFAHSVCPDGLYAGDMACDGSTNGAYSVERVIRQLFVKTCADCTTDEVARLNAIVQDVSIRILPGSQDLDPQPESLQ